MGPAARFPTANIDAFKQLAWAKSDLKSIIDQWNYIEEVPEIPGSYYTARGIENAFADVVYSASNYRDALQKWNEQINNEITRKRLEFVSN